MTAVTGLQHSGFGQAGSPTADRDGGTRFLFENADWAFYEAVRERLADRHVFVTYHKGRLELVTVSLLHEMVVGLLAQIVRVLAEETRTPIKGSGMVTLRRRDLDQGTEADSSFYTVNEARMRGKTELDLAVDPPPDLAIEVEITKRLGERKTIYRELGVPELWVYSAVGLTVLVRQVAGYVPVDRSPTFPQFSPAEMFELVAAGLSSDDTTWVVALRERVRRTLAP